MIVTEQEAKKLWCPHRSRQHLNESNCMASACMWWVLSLPRTPQSRLCPNQLATVEPHRMVGLPDDWTFVPFDAEEGTWARWVEPDAAAEARRTGRCGVAHT